jgi:hypothetical protein
LRAKQPTTLKPGVPLAKPRFTPGFMLSATVVGLNIKEDGYNHRCLKNNTDCASDRNSKHV